MAVDPVGIVRISEKAFELVRNNPSAQIAYTLYDTEDGNGRAAGWRARIDQRGPRADGRVWFVSTTGITIVDPRMITDDFTVPPIHIEGIVADARRLGARPQLRLTPKTSTIEIDYSAVTFSSPKKVRYRSPSGRIRSRLARSRYAPRSALHESAAWRVSLPRGRRDSERGFGAEEAATDFVLLPTFYQTWWF
jgi:hypothetical protein